LKFQCLPFCSKKNKIQKKSEKKKKKIQNSFLKRQQNSGEKERKQFRKMEKKKKKKKKAKVKEMVDWGYFCYFGLGKSDIATPKANWETLQIDVVLKVINVVSHNIFF
jgi:hypothetical protein